MLPENAYGNVVEAAFKQAVGRRGGRVVAFEKYGADRTGAARTIAQALGSADALFLADDGDSVVGVADALTSAGANLKNLQLLGTGLWDNPRIFATPALQGGLYAAPDPAGFRSFSPRATARNSAPSRCVPRRWPTMPSPWSRRWQEPRAASASRRKCSPIRRDLRASMACFAFGPMAPTSAASR